MLQGLLGALSFAACHRAATQAQPVPADARQASATATSVVAATAIGDGATDPPVGERITLSEAAWRARLTPAQYEVLREHGTETAFTGAYWDNHASGAYYCAGCGAPLFRSSDKFESGTGWPSYTRPIADGRVETTLDSSHGMERDEVHCARCGGHLGHVFDDGPPPTGKRYCINSVSLTFRPGR